MTVDDIKEFYGFEYDSDVATKFNFSKTAVSKWRERGIPPERQAVIQILSKNKLKADLTALHKPIEEA